LIAINQVQGSDRTGSGSVSGTLSKIIFLTVLKNFYIIFQGPFAAGASQQNIFAAGPSPFGNTDFSLAELDPLKK
jgi:hypothetical protein